MDCTSKKLNQASVSNNEKKKSQNLVSNNEITKNQNMVSNYEITKNQMQIEFLEYNQEEMIKKFNLPYDEEYLYITFVGRPYRINRKTGLTEWSDDGFVNCYEGAFNAAMTMYDVLCYSKPDCHLSGKFELIDSLKCTGYTSGPGNKMFADYERAFDHQCEKLSLACEKLGGTKQKVGDVSYYIPVFEFLPLQLQFWESDDEFPAKLKFMWDENIISYMHYETTFYVLQYVSDQLVELL